VSGTDTILDLAVVGAGPAGLAAAAAAGEHGLATAVFDEAPVAGGRLLGQLHPVPGGWWVGRAEAARLVAAVQDRPTVALRLGAGVYAADREEGGFRLYASDSPAPVRARHLLVATGATELPVPLPGWNLPGVITAGAAQTLANVWGVEVGRHAFVVGLSPLAFAVALELGAAGVPPAAIAPPAPGPALAHLGSPVAQWREALRLARLGPAWARPGAALLASPALRRALLPRLPRSGLPLLGSRLRLNVAVEAVVGREKAEGVRLRRLDGDGRPVGPPWVEAADAVLMAGGLRPVPDLLRALGARMTTVEELGGEVPVVDPDGATSVPGLYAAGNALGVEGAAVAMAQGRRAAVAVAARLGRADGRAQAEARAAVERARADAPFAFHAGVAEGHRRVAALWQELGGGDGHAV
jgi:sarcosine oxidase subunit alpha